MNYAWPDNFNGWMVLLSHLAKPWLFVGIMYTFIGWLSLRRKRQNEKV